MPKNRLNSVNRLGTMMTTRRIGNGGGLILSAPSGRGILRQHGAPHADPVPRLDLHGGPGRQREEDVGTRAEADQAEPRRLRGALAQLPVGDDAARDQSGDLAYQHPSARPAHSDGGLLV